MKLSVSKIKLVALVLFIILSTIFSILIDFIAAEFSTSVFTNAAYWLNVISVQFAVTILLFASRALYKEKERNINETYLSLQKNLQNAYVTINDRDLNGKFKEYIAEDNRARKLKHYREKINAHIAKYEDKIKRYDLHKGRIEKKFKEQNKAARGIKYNLTLFKIKRTEDKRDFWKDKFERSEEEVDYVRVKHIKYSYSIIFNDAKEKESEENDPYAHEGREVLFMILTKGISVFAFGVIATSFVVFDLSFSWGMVYKAVVKLFQIVLGLYTGAIAGQEFIRCKMCAKLTTRFNYVKQFMEKRNAVEHV